MHNTTAKRYRKKSPNCTINMRYPAPAKIFHHEKMSEPQQLSAHELLQ